MINDEIIGIRKLTTKPINEGITQAMAINGKHNSISFHAQKSIAEEDDSEDDWKDAEEDSNNEDVDLSLYDPDEGEFSIYNEDIDELLGAVRIKKEKTTANTFRIDGNATTSYVNRFNYQDNRLVLREYLRTGSPEMLAILVETNQRLVVTVALKYCNSVKHAGIDLDDLVQVGMMGLIKAIRKYDANKGELSTYSIWWIRQVIHRYILDNANQVRIPVHMGERIRKMKRLERVSELMGTTLHRRLCENYHIDGFTLDVYQKCKQIEHQFWSIVSLDSPVGDEEDSFLLNYIPAGQDVQTPEDVVCDLDETRRIYNAMRLLPDKSFDIIVKRLGLFGEEPETLEEIGRHYSVTRERIRQIEGKAMNKLRNYIRKKKDGELVCKENLKTRNTKGTKR